MSGEPALRPLLIATTNTGKVREIRRIFDGLPIDILSLADRPGIDAPEETGRTFEENARDKALYYAKATGLPCVAEDSGLEIDALDKAPGVLSARFGGAETSYAEKFDLIYRQLRARGAAGSTARFVCAAAIAVDGGILVERRGTVEGEIAPAPSGHGGFGYDPIFFYPPYGRTLANVSEAEKTAVSHRGKAFRALRKWLEANAGADGLRC